MADNMISPGVYSQIFSLSSYLNATPGSIGFVPVITEKGKDNVLYRCTGLDDYLQNFGEPDIRTFGKYYGCGPYIATQHLSVSNDLYVVRCLPDDAIYAHTYIYFADIKDFPTDKRFVELYKGYIYDPKTVKEIEVWHVDDAKLANAVSQKGLSNVKKEIAYTEEISWKEAAFEAGVGINQYGKPALKAEDVVYVTDIDYAEPTQDGSEIEIAWEKGETKKIGTDENAETYKTEQDLYNVNSGVKTTREYGTRFFDEGHESDQDYLKDIEIQDTDKLDDIRWTNNFAYALATGGTPYYDIDATKTQNVDTEQTWKEAAFEAGVGLDSTGEEAQTADDVVYVNDPSYSGSETPVEGQTYYTVKTGYVQVSKTYRDLAIANNVAYTSTLEKYVKTQDSDDLAAIYTSDSQYAVKAGEPAVAKVKGYLIDDNVEYTSKKRTTYIESITSSKDNNVGSYKMQMSFYSGTHIGLSAFSVEPDVKYPITSDVTCFVQPSYVGTLYNIKTLNGNPDPTAQSDAFARRVGYNEDKYLELKDKSRIVYTSHAELADPEDDIIGAVDSDNKRVLGVIPVWSVDAEPWYALDTDDPTKVANAIDTHNAYDENGFLTTDKKKAKYCADFQYAMMDGDKYIEETFVALKSPVGDIPAKQKFKPSVGNYLYVLDRSMPSDQTAKAAKEEAIRKLCAECEAFDENGYPTMDWEKAVITTNKAFAKTALTPKMSTTQKLDSLFYGNDTLIAGVIDNLEGKSITTTVFPHEAVLAYVRAVGRGDYYNDYSIKIVSDANPANFGTYKFQVFELQDGSEVLAESFNVSFDPTALDGDGESLYFADVINKFSTRVVVEPNENAVALFKEQIRAFYENDPTLEGIADDYTLDDGTLLLNKAFPAVPYYDKESGLIEAQVQVFDSEGLPERNPNTGALVKTQVPGPEYGYKAQIMFEAYYAKAWAEKATADAAERYNQALELVNSGEEGATVELGLAIDDMNLAQDMTATAADIYAWATSRNLMDLNDSDAISTGEQPYYLQNGSMGSLLDKKGNVNPVIGNQILSYGYTGLLKNPVVVKSVDESTGSIKYKQQYTDNVYDIDWIYFSIVYDPGYKPDVKQAALDLVDTYRRDCVLISDCGDNADYEDCLKYVGAIKGAADAHMWNTYLAARYEPYSRIYDKFTGKDIWVSPVYHMAKMIPQNDALYDLWYASAGFRRGTVASIKELRYSPNKSMRDQLYLAQVNPIVHFPEGMTVWGMLTTQKKNDALSDLPAVRTLLYIKRALEQYCRNYIFEFNDSTTWSAIQTNVNSFLSKVREAGGIEGFSCSVGATDYELKTKTCHVNVTLTMRKILEKIKLNFYVQ